MKYLFLFILLFSILNAQSISNVSGTFEGSETVVISGSSFGSKDLAEPLIWDNFESGSGSIIGESPTIENLSGYTWVSIGGTAPSYSTTNHRIGSTQSSLHSYTSVWVSGFVVSLNWEKCFLSLWWRFERLGSTWSRNTKPFIMEANDESPFAYAGFGQYGIDPALRSNVTSASTLWGSTSLGPDMESEWIRFDVWLVQSSPNTGDGQYQVWVHRPDGENPIDLDLSNTSISTRTNSEYWQRLCIQTYSSVDGGASQRIFLDDVYIDSTMARVEIGNNSVFANCSHREIQVPTAWATGEITITFNQGSFEADDNVWLFVVDSDGDVSSGYAITIGGEGSGEAPATGDGSKCDAISIEKE